MKILESIIWLSEENKNKIKELIPGFIPIINGEITQSIRMPFNNRHVWNFYLLNPEIEEDVYLYQHFDETVLSHIFLLNEDNEENIKKTEELIDSFTGNFEQAPVCFFHFLNSKSRFLDSILKTYWKIEPGLFFTWQKKFLPLSNWNQISLDYYEKMLKTVDNGFS